MVLGLILFLAALAVVILGLLSVEFLIYIIDPASVFLVHGGTLVLLWSSYSVRDILEAVGFLLSRDSEIPIKKAAKLTGIYNATGDYGLYTGLLGAYIGFVLILQTFNDPSQLGAVFAVCSITYLYGFSVYALAVLANRKLALCTKTDSACEIKPRKSVLWMCLGTLLFLVVIILGIQTSGSVVSFVDPPSLLLILGGSILGLLFLVPMRDLLDLTRLLLKREAVSEENACKALGAFAQFNDLVVTLVVIAVGAGVIRLLPSLDQPEKIGPIMAFCFMSIFYGTILLCIARAKECILHRSLADLGLKIESKPRFSATWMAGISLIIYLLMIASLMYVILPD